MSANHSLRCMKCFKKYERAWLMSAGYSLDGYRDNSLIKWRNVHVTGATAGGIPVCECKTCGHVYRSDSICARRAYKRAMEHGDITGPSDNKH